MNSTIKHLFLITGLMFALSAKAQVGIGTSNPDASAQLEVSSSSRGVLIPRMTLAQRNDIISPANGLVVYQTNNTPGFYYYSGGQWQKLASSEEIGSGGNSAGNNILNGTGDPGRSQGNDGDFYINTSTYTIFGPKQSGSWPSTGVAMIGASGESSVNSHNVTSSGTIQIGNGTKAALSPLTLDLADNAVTTAKIADGTISNEDLDKKAIPLSGFGVPLANISMNGFKLTNLAAPVLARDAVNKKYVDDLVSAGTGSNSLQSLGLDANHNLSISGSNSVSLLDLYQSMSLAGTVLSLSGPRNSHIDLAGILPSGAGSTVSHDLSLSGSGLPSNPLSIAVGGVGLNKLAAIPSGTILANNALVDESPKAITWAELKAMMPYTKADVGLGNADNTADADKSVLSAGKLTTPRLINGVAFDGSTDISIADATKQAADDDLTALAGLAANGIIVRTADGTAAARTLTAGAGIEITNGDGINANPGIALAASGATAGSYTNANITIDASGRVTAASNGAAGGGSGTDDQTAAEVAFTPAGGLTATDVQAAMVELKGLADASTTALGAKLDANAAITGATKTKITYDSNGLVTAGADATTADISDSADKRYVSDAQLSTLANTSNTNTGDQTATTVPVSPGGGLTSTNVQAALLELQGKITTAAAGGMTAVARDATLTGDGNTTNLGLADNAVTAAKIVNGTITNEKLADATISNAKLVDGTITATKIADGTISDAKLASISGSKVNGNITGHATNVTGVVAIANGGTGASTATGAINALLPSQTSNSGKVLQTDGTNVSWVPAASGTVKHDATLTGDGNTTNLGLADNAVTAAKIAAGTITPLKLSNISGNGTNGQVLVSDGAGGFAWSTGGSGAGDMLKATYDAANVAEQVVGLTATQTLTNKSLTSPALTGVPTAPTATTGTNTDQVATTAFVQATAAAGTPDATSLVNGKIRLAGDLSGTADAPAIKAGAITPSKLNNISGNGISGQVLSSDGSGGFNWTTAGTSANIASNTILGNNTGGPAAATGLTAAQVKTLLALAKADVGLSNVQNIDQTNASNLSTGTVPAALLPIAGATTLGGVKVGAGLSIDAGGMLNATGGSGSAANLTLGTSTATALPIVNSNGTGVSLPQATTTAAGLLTASDKVKLDGIASGANNYALPTASAGTIGGVRVGTGLTVDGSGILSSTGGLNPIATKTLLGNKTASSAVPVGLDMADVKTLLNLTSTDVGLSNVKNFDQTNAANISSGILPAARLPIAAAGTLGGIRVGTGLAIDGSGILSVSSTASASNLALGTATTTTLPVTNSNGSGITLPAATGSAAGLLSSADKTKLDGIVANANNYALPNATGTVLGGVRVGTGLSIDGNGVLSATGGSAAPADLDLGTRTTTEVPVTNSNGRGFILPAASATQAGVMPAADKAKLDKIADITAADANKVLTVNSAGTAATWVTPAAGGGGSKQVYNPSGNPKFLVRATGPGVTCTLSGSVISVTIPPGVEVDYLKVRTTSTEIGGNMLFFEITGLPSTAPSGVDNVIIPIATVGSPQGGLDVIRGMNTQNYSQFIDTYSGGKLAFRLLINADATPDGYYVMLRI